MVTPTRSGRTSGQTRSGGAGARPRDGTAVSRGRPSGPIGVDVDSVDEHGRRPGEPEPLGLFCRGDHHRLDLHRRREALHDLEDELQRLLAVAAPGTHMTWRRASPRLHLGSPYSRASTRGVTPSRYRKGKTFMTTRYLRGRDWKRRPETRTEHGTV